MHHWFEESTYLILLTVPRELALHDTLIKLGWHDLIYSVWHEPDMNNELTAVAVAPSPTATRYLSQLPLTLRAPAMT